MLTNEQREAEAVIFARVCCPPGKHMLIGFEIWKACAERLLPVIVAADVIAKHLQDVDDEGSSVYSTELIAYRDSKEEAGLC